MNYLETLNTEKQKYFKILCDEFPNWLLNYVNTPEMQRIGSISISCGADYTKLYNVKYWYSNLDHSVAVALIIWNFTHDKKQTLAGLFHDIAIPTFKHCIDFLNGDHEKQESIDDRIFQILRNSSEIAKLLKRDGIEFHEVDDYTLYPIADNQTPRLSADRFEYTFSSGLTFTPVWNLDDIKECYDNIIIVKNEDGFDELCFRDIAVCDKYVNTISKQWPRWIDNRDKVMMQFFADIVGMMIVRGYISVDELYVISEKEVIDKILNNSDDYISNRFKRFQESNDIFESDSPVKGKYCISVKSKRRYIIPLVINNDIPVRINEASSIAANIIDDYLNFETAKYAGLDFEFDPKK